MIKNGDRSLSVACNQCGASMNEVCKNLNTGEDLPYTHLVDIEIVYVVVDPATIVRGSTFKIIGVYRELSNEQSEAFEREGYEIHESELR